MQWLTDVTIIIIVMFLAGLVKGMIGMGLPLIASGLLLLFFPPLTVLGIIAPNVLMMNVWQALRAGRFTDYMKRFWTLAITMIVFMLVTAYGAALANPRWIYFSLAIGLSLFLLTQLKSVPVHEKELKNEKMIAGIVGGFAGVIGGLSSAWSPPTAMFFHYLGLKKEDFIHGMGWTFLIGSIPLNAGYIANGILNTTTLPLALTGLVSAWLAFGVGEKLRHTINEAVFKKIVLCFLFIITINMFYKFIST